MTTMTANWNPFAVVDHNEHRTWRLVFHAAHIAIGLPIALAGRILHADVAWLIAAAVTVAMLDKCSWIDWHRSSGKLLHWTGLHGLGDPWHFVSDAAFTTMGALALVMPWWGWCFYYPLSVVNDT